MTFQLIETEYSSLLAMYRNQVERETICLFCLLLSYSFLDCSLIRVCIVASAFTFVKPPRGPVLAQELINMFFFFSLFFLTRYNLLAFILPSFHFCFKAFWVGWVQAWCGPNPQHAQMPARKFSLY